MANEGQVIYWDASAILSVLLADKHSEIAADWVRKAETHLISTLAHSETCAVIARLEKEGHLTPVLANEALQTLMNGPWRRLNAWPDWDEAIQLSRRWSLRGADLWHLATSAKLQTEIPELTLLTFDTKLHQAALGERLASHDFLNGV